MLELFIDCETFYSKDYTLRKLTPVEYILDPRFEMIGLSVATRNKPARWIDGDKVPALLRSLPPEVSMTSHNALFDMGVLSYRYGYVPTRMVDTLGMARALLASQLKSLSLDSVAKHLGLGVKGSTIKTVVGMNAAAIKQQGIWDEYTEYCRNDTELCRGIFLELMARGFPASELVVMDEVLRTCVVPKFQLKGSVLAKHLAKVQLDKETLLQKCGLASRDELMSNEKFAQLLEAEGVDPPMKVSQLTGKETYAFAKTDGAFIELEEHPSATVQALVAARLGVKTTIEETRTQRFLDILKLNWNGVYPQTSMPIPLRYGAAHTHRLGGDWALNLQNLPRGGNLRRALTAPLNHSVVTVDSSQIEARMVAWLAGQDDMVEAFAQGRDVYAEFATDLFRDKLNGAVVTKATYPIERWLGKTCLSEETPVLTDRGPVAIKDVTVDHLLWDGEEWVNHSGLVDNGMKQTLQLCGVWLTPDHQVWCGTGWQEAISLTKDAASLSRALVTAAVNLPSQVTSEVPVEALLRSSLSANAQTESTQSTRVISKTSNLRGVITAQKQRRVKNAIGHMLKLCLTTVTALVYSIVSRLQYQDATYRRANNTYTMANGGYLFTRAGVMTGRHFLSTFRLCPAGTSLNTRWIEPTSMVDTSRVTSASFHDQLTYTTNDVSQTLRRKLRVYDLANAGPRHRFTILTDAGPLIVHNCILGLGYGVGWKKFQASVKSGSRKELGKVVELADDEAQRIVNMYRARYPMIVKLWRKLDKSLEFMTMPECHIQIGPVVLGHEEVLLPNGLKLYYHKLEHNGMNWMFQFGRLNKHIYGAKLLENISQALSRLCTFDAAARIRDVIVSFGDEHLRLALQVHDELVYVPHNTMVNVMKKILHEEMCVRPWWGPDLPLAAEVGVGQNYADAK